jgi:hypothetical protein
MTSGIKERVRLQRQTVIKALNEDEASGFAVARFALEEGDTAWNPDGPVRFAGPLKITYERHHGRVTVRGVT